MHARVVSMVAILRSEDYFAVGRSARFRAVLRRQTYDAARAAMLVVVGVAVFDIVTFAVTHSADLGLIVGLNVTVAVVAILGRLVLDAHGPRVADLVAFTIALGVVAATFVLGVLGTNLAILATGYLILIPPTVALVLPWQTWTHMIWLLAYAAVTFAFILLAPALSSQERVDVAILASISMLASFAGHVLWIRVRVRVFQDVSDIHALRHEAETQRRASTRAQAALELTVRQDQLTGAGNRLRLHEDLQAERSRIDRTGASCGMLEADIDHFKAVNDQLGHLAGDTVLREVSALLQRMLRAGDTVYRWGGEEFLILLPGAEAQETAAAAERLRSAIQAAGFVQPAHDPEGVLTVSIGGTVIRRANLSETDEVWIGRTDRALYRAKTEGRNRVAIELPAESTVKAEIRGS